MAVHALIRPLEDTRVTVLRATKEIAVRKWTGSLRDAMMKERGKKRLLRKRFKIVRKGINRKDPDVELMFSQCKAIAEKEGYEIFAIRRVNRCYTSKHGKLVDFKKYGASSKCRTDEHGHGVGMDAQANFVYTR